MVNSDYSPRLTNHFKIRLILSVFLFLSVTASSQNGRYKNHPALNAKDFLRAEQFAGTRADANGSMDTYGKILQKVRDSLRNVIEAERNSLSTSSSRNIYRHTQWYPLGPFVNEDTIIALQGQACSIWVDTTDFQTIYAGSNTGGLFATYDGGENWQPLTDNFLTTGVLAIDVDPIDKQHIYIGTGHWGFNRAWGEGVMESFDGGLTWSHTGLNPEVLSGGKLVHDLKLHQQHHDTLYAMVNGEFQSSTSIYRSMDKGVNWEQVFYRPQEELFDFVTTPRRPDVIFAVGSLFLRSNDAGTTWTDYTHRFKLAPNHKISRLTLSMNDSVPGFMLVFLESYDTVNPGNYDQRLYRSINDGRYFKEIGIDYQPFSGYWKMELQLSPTDPQEFYLGGVWFFKYRINGDTARYLEYYNHKYHKDVRDLLVYKKNGSDILIMANDGGITRSDDGAIKWRDITRNGFQATQYHNICTSDKGNMVYGGPQDGNICFYNYTNGKWTTETHMADAYDGMVDFNDPKYVYIVTIPPKQNRKNIFLLKSDDAGLSFNFRGVPDTTERGRNNIPVAMHPTDPKTMFAGLKNVWKSTDRAETWEKISSFNPFNTNKLQSIEVSPSDPDVICVSFENPSWGNDQIEKVMITTDGGDKWTDITPRGTYSLWYASVVDILIHPENPANIYLALDRTWEGRRIYVTQNGGRTWQNFSDGLPPIPVNALRYFKGAGYDILFAATDAGVYYRDAFMSRWEIFGEGLPITIISDIEINYQRKKLVAGTFGRGLWEADICLPLDETATLVSDTTDWLAGRNLLSDLILMPGSKLTMTGKIEVGEGRKITVMPGAHLVLNGATLTNNCLSLWEGIRVYGNPDYDSGLPQGRVSILFGSVIENAYTGIELTAMDENGNIDSLRGGGIVYAKRSLFRNNLRSVVMKPSKGVNPSKFILTEFTLKKQVWPGEKMQEFVNLNSNQGIEFISCIFRNDVPSSELQSPHRGTGIRAFNSSIKLYKIEADSVPFGVASKPLFYQLKTGIDAQVSTPGYAVFLDEITFKNNYTGAYLSGYSIVESARCSYELSSINAVPLQNKEIAGLYLDHCSIFNIHGNTFKGSSMPGFNNLNSGLVINNCGEFNNNVAGNNFTNLDYSVLAQNKNRDTNGSQGLRFYFNRFMNNQYDISVTTDSVKNINGIAYYQGSGGLLTGPAGNRFSNNKSHRTGDFHNEGLTLVYSQFRSSQANPKQQPMFFSNLLLSQSVNVVPGDSLYLPSWISADTFEFGNTLENWKNIRESAHNDFIQTIDGGRSADLVREIRHTSPAGVPELYKKLRQLDSKLSVAALRALLKLEYFHNTLLIDILVNNPVIFRDETVYPLILERVPEFPAYMLVRLSSGPFNFSLTELLEADDHNASAVCDAILSRVLNRLYLDNTLKAGNEISQLTESDNRLPLRVAQAFKYNTTGNKQSAIEKLDLLYKDYNDSTDYLNKLSALLDLNIQLQENVSDSLTQEQLNILTWLLDNYPTSIYANNLLKKYGYSDYSEPYILPSGNPPSPFFEMPVVDIKGSSLRIYPQPANDYFIVDYFFETGFEQGELEITNLMGQKIASYPVKTPYGQKLIEVNEYLPGVYLVRLISNNSVITFKKIMIMK